MKKSLRRWEQKGRDRRPGIRGIGTFAEGILLFVILAIIFALALAWRLRYANQAEMYTYDSYFYLVLARNLRNSFFYGVAGHPHVKFLPLYPMAMAFMGLFTGDWNLIARISNPLFSSLCVFPLYLAGREFFGRRAGLAAAAVYAVEPITTYWSSVPMSEGLFTLLLCLSAMGLARWWRRGGRGWLYLSALFAGLSTVTRWEGLLFLALIGLAALLFWARGRLRLEHLVAFGVIALIPLGLYLIRNQLTFGNPLKSAYLQEVERAESLGLAFGAGERLRRYLLFGDLDPLRFGTRLYPYAFLLLGYGGIVYCLLRWESRGKGLFLGLWVFLVGQLHFLWYFLSNRFLYPSVPAMCLGAGALLGVPWPGLKGGRGWLYRMWALLLLAITVLFLFFLARPATEDFFLKSIRALDDDTGGMAAREALTWMRDQRLDGEVVTNLGPAASFYLGRDALFLGEWQYFEPADVRQEEFLEDVKAKNVRYLVLYAWEPSPEAAFRLACLDLGLLTHMRLLGTWHSPPNHDINRDSYAFVFEIEGIGSEGGG
ncbi:MAG: glycosyltransferase family 39 protein [Candidatus Geothermincolales bacterium]